jgi:hypothetical protein
MARNVLNSILRSIRKGRNLLSILDYRVEKDLKSKYLPVLRRAL